MFYLVERTDEIGWDEYDSFVIKADNKEKALAMAHDQAGNQWRGEEKPYFREDNTRITELSDKMDDGIILGSFNAG